MSREPRLSFHFGQGPRGGRSVRLDAGGIAALACVVALAVIALGAVIVLRL